MRVVGTGHVVSGCTVWWLGVTRVAGHRTDVDTTVKVTGMITGNCINAVAVITITSTAGWMGLILLGSEGSWRNAMTAITGNG